MKTTTETAESYARLAWPTMWNRDERTSTAGNRLQSFFCDDERYSFDFLPGIFKQSGWYQFDTQQDAPYYGTWVNPRLQAVILYCEGDINVIDCETPEAYRAEIKSMEDWNDENDGKPKGRSRIDDHDGRHWEKLDAIV